MIGDRLCPPVSHRVPRTLPRPAALTAYALALAYVGGVWTDKVHQLDRLAEQNQTPTMIAWLRDATLSLPVLLVAVWVALLLARRLLARDSVDDSHTLAGLAATATVALGASLVAAATGPIHNLVFPAQYAGDQQLATILAGMARDGVLALVANLGIAGAVTALLRAQVWVAPPGARLAKPTPLHRSVAARGLVALMLVLPAAANNTTGQPLAIAATDPGAPCPASAPIKTFDVQAIDVNIPINRFGDHDPAGKMYVLSQNVAAVRAQEASGQVSTGLQDDAIQPLVIRANEGDCVQITFTNHASGGTAGIHIDGLSFQVGSSGDAVGNNAASDVPLGGTQTYRYYVPNDPSLEGAHYLHPGPGNREAVLHGLFGELVAEPPDSTYLDNSANQPLASGFAARIVPAAQPAFREFVMIYHEIGNESEDPIFDRNGNKLPKTDPFTAAYRPGTRAMNYRSEPFINRLAVAPEQESQGYGSYTFGDPATPRPRSYLADPVKYRLSHGGSDLFHVPHQHGGGIRWRLDPKSDPTFNYAQTGLDKTPQTVASPSERTDSQSIGPGENYNLEFEGGSGGPQQSVGDFLFHCHIAEHYVAGMWTFWRVFNTAQPDLAPLPDRAAPAQAVTSAGLIGKTFNGVPLTRDNLDAWIRPQLPPQGVRKSSQDGSVWNWTIDSSNPSAPLYLGEPEDTSSFPDLANVVPGHPGSLLGDVLDGNRPEIMFDPLNGRPAYPLLRTHVGQRPPFSPNGHSGAPYLGENANQAPTAGQPSPFAGRPDGLCLAGAATRHFNIVALELPIPVTKTSVDPNGDIYALAHDKVALLGGSKVPTPLAIRANIGDCVALTLTSEQHDNQAFDGFAKVNIHIHHMQFDVQGSDGVISGFAFEQSVRPYQLEDPQLMAPAAAGATTLTLASVAKFQPGVWVGVGLGTEGIEIHQISSIDAARNTVMLATPLTAAHAAGEWAGTEFVQYRWYPDVQLDNVFWHDHVDGIHTWGHGLVGQIIVEPKASTYNDPVTGAEVDSGTIVDIRTNSPLVPGIVNGSFRELALWEIDENPITDSTLNLRAEPISARQGDPSLHFSSFTFGDPFTPLPRAYPGDQLVIRLINASQGVDDLHVDGHRFFVENRYLDANGTLLSSPIDTIHIGISERFTLIIEGGAGGPLHRPGDYLYMNGVDRRFKQGAWGILRVLPHQVPDLQPLPSTSPPQGGAPLPVQTGGRPPAVTNAFNPCPAGAPPHTFAVSAIDSAVANTGGPQSTGGGAPGGGGGGGGGDSGAIFVPTAQVAAVQAGTLKPEPLVLQVADGECVTVNFTNQRSSTRASFHLNGLLHDSTSSGINVGFSPEQTVAPGQSQTYTFYADEAKIGSAPISDFGGDNSGKGGLYGAAGVAPAGATFTDPVTGAPRDIGTQVDVHVPGTTGYRDFTLAFSENDPRIGQSHMPYPPSVDSPVFLNYQVAPRPDDTNHAFSSAATGDPPTPILRAYAGDPVHVHAFVAPGGEQLHVFNLGGLSFPLDPQIPRSEVLASRAMGTWEKVDAVIVGGAGGRRHAVGDFFYGDLRRPFTQAGLWGIQRVLSDASCPIKPLDGLSCVAQPPILP